MKKAITKSAVLLLLTVYCLLFTAYSQVPQAFNYQAIARDNFGNLLASQSIGIKIIIHQGSSSGTEVYSETFTKTTTQFGLFTLPIGQGVVTSGNFNSIVWSTGNYWLQVQIDPAGGASYTDMGTSQLLSVPYAMYAANSGTGSNLWTTGSNGIYPAGNTNIMVYNAGQQYAITGKVSVSTAGTDWIAPKAGIFGESHSQSYQAGIYGYVEGSGIANEAGVVGAYSNSIFGGLGYHDGTNAWAGYFSGSIKITGGSPGAGKVLTSDAYGGASWQTPSGVSGLPSGTSGQTLRHDGSNWVANSLLFNNGTNIGIGTTSPSEAIDVAGNINLGLNNVIKINTSTVFNIKGVGNLFVGEDAGKNNSNGGCLTFLGYMAGYNNTTGDYNNFIGYEAGFSNVVGEKNYFFGNRAGFTNKSSDNMYIGFYSGYLNETGSYNVFIGNYSGYKTTASNNTFIGFNSGYENTSGNNNTFLGKNAGATNIDGGDNVFIGSNSGGDVTSGYKNIFIGQMSGNSVTTGHNLVCVGDQSTLYNYVNSIALGYNINSYTGDNRANIGNSSMTWIGGQVGWSTYSDERIKDNIKEDVPGLAFITKLHPVTYNLNIHRQKEMSDAYLIKTIKDFDKNKKEETNWPSKYDIEKITMTGFLAQDVYKAAKDIGYDFSGVTVPKDSDDIYSLRYSEFVVPLVKAVQELNEKNITLQTTVETQNDTITILQEENKSQLKITEDLQKQIDELKKLVVKEQN